MANPFVHIELQTRDIAKAKDFYSRLFDWKLEDLPAPGGDIPYTMINVGEGTGGGMFANGDPKNPLHWLAYVGMDDIEASTRKARDLGATILQDVKGWLEPTLFQYHENRTENSNCEFKSICKPIPASTSRSIRLSLVG